jgi:adenylate cyclase
LRERTARQIRIVAGVTLAGAALGAFYGTRSGTHGNIAVSTMSGGLSALLLSLFEILPQAGGAPILRRLPVALAIGLRTLIYGGVFVLSSETAAALVRAVSATPLAGSPVSRASLIFGFSVSFVFNFAFTLRRLLGPGALLALTTGRYHRPRAETRIVLFLDLRDSTSIAERLGDASFHRFLNRVFFDITDPIIESGGEIYRYVGDEIIVTWTLARGGRHRACIACLFAIADALARRREDYQRAFGVEPRLRGGLHAGPLVIGEMGDVKREIVMLGDTMNTTARIEDACRTTGRAYIASEAAVRAAGPLPPGVRSEKLEAMKLRGKEGEVPLFGLARD